MSRFMELSFSDRDNKQMIAMLNKRIMKKLKPDDTRIRVFGELDPQQLMDLGLKVDSECKLSRSSMDEIGFSLVYSQMAGAMYERPIPDDGQIMFIPENIFRRNEEEVLILQPCNATHPKNGSKADPGMDPWVAMLRSTYTEQEANNILDYLLERYSDAMSQASDDAGKAPRKLWDYKRRDEKHPTGQEMKPWEKFELLLELEEKERKEERQAVVDLVKKMCGKKAADKVRVLQNK